MTIVSAWLSPIKQVHFINRVLSAATVVHVSNLTMTILQIASGVAVIYQIKVKSSLMLFF